jgi:hypothetical protein
MRTIVSPLQGIVAAIFAVLLMVVPAGCGKSDKSNDITNALALPPQSSLFTDFSSFPTVSSQAAASLVSRVTISGQSNFAFSAVNVIVWNTVITVGLAVPVYTFLEAFNHRPTLQPDGSWLWSYSKTILLVTYTAKLYGKINGDHVDWSMYISKAGDFTDFNWFNGTADLAGTNGNWTMKKSPSDPVDLLSIDWARNAAADTGHITYTNVEPGGPENGGYISYGNDGTTDPTYDAYYNIYNKGKDDLINIEWNLTTKEGRVKNPAAFGDSNWHYWNSALQDV